MTDQKPFASLTSGLLARKGAARPAMRPQVMDQKVSDQAGASLEDLGWNDMGDGAGPYDDLPEHVPSSIAALTPAPRQPSREAEIVAEPPVVEQMRAIEAHFGEAPELEDEAAKEAFDEPAAVSAAEVVSLPSRRVPEVSCATGKCAFTLRLDDQRHLRLRLATAVQNRSAQRIVTEALDAYLNALPELDTLAQQVPFRQGKRN